MEITRLSAAEVLASLRSSVNWLDSAEAARRLHEFGPNRIEEAKDSPLWLKFLREFTHFFALILWVAAALAFLSEVSSPGGGMWQLGAAIIAVIVLNGVFSFMQEYRAERAIAALRQLLPATVKVLRDGEMRVLQADLLVPGDMVLLEQGDNVPADCRLITAFGLRVNLSTITGESLARARAADPATGGSTLDASNLLLAGTALVSGQGRAVVYATGMRTEFGRIAHLTPTVGEAGSPLQREIARLSRLIAALAFTLGLACVGIGMVMGLPFWHSAMFAIGIIVANVPEGLLPTVTLSLAMATQRMARRNALVRHLPSVETLGSTTVICSDKTGTLTQNRMSVKRVYVGRLREATDDIASIAADAHLLRNARNCHNLKRGGRDRPGTWLGDPMEIALAEFGGSGHEVGMVDVIADLAFDSERRRMSVVVGHGGGRWLYCKGAPEIVLRGGGWTYGEPLGRLDPLYLQATTACLAAIVVAQVVNVFSCRHPEKSIFAIGFLNNPLLFGGVGVEIMLLLLIVYTNPGNAAFGTAPLPASAWALMVALAVGIGLLEDLRKRFIMRRPI